MTNGEKYKKAFSVLQTSKGSLQEVENMAKLQKRTKMKTAAAVIAGCIILGGTGTAYAANVGGIQRKVQIWLHGDQTQAVHHQLADDHDNRQPYGQHMQRGQENHHRDGEDFIGDGIGKFAKVRDQLVPARDLAIQKIRHARQRKYRGRPDKLPGVKQNQAYRHQRDAQQRQLVWQVHASSSSHSLPYRS